MLNQTCGVLSSLDCPRESLTCMVRLLSVALPLPGRFSVDPAWEVINLLKKEGR